MTATTEALEATIEPGRPTPWLRFGLAAILGLAIAMLVGLGGLYAYDQLYAGKILPGVTVGSVDLSGLTPDAGRAELNRVYGSLSDGRIVVAAPDGEQVITYEEIGRGPAIETLLDAAMAVGRRGSPLDRMIADVRTAMRGVALEPSVTVRCGRDHHPARGDGRVGQDRAGRLDCRPRSTADLQRRPGVDRSGGRSSGTGRGR